MFTGLVEEKGTLSARRASGPGAVLTLRAPWGGPTRASGASPRALELGESISVDGVCLTVTRMHADGFEADASSETLERTTLGTVEVGSIINLERAVPLGARMGGHTVTGHVDGMCTLTAKKPLGAAIGMTFTFPERLARLIAEKGSVAVNGVSLTVNAVTMSTLDVVIIPHTRDATSLDHLAVGGRANLEVDILARYIARLYDVTATGAARPTASDDAWMERLHKSGYV